MEQGNFEEWKIEGITNDLYFQNAFYESQTITLTFGIFDVAEKKLRIVCRGVLGYEIFHEAARNRTLYKNQLLRGFMKSKKSDLLKWFHEESSGIFEEFNLTHYYIANIDVIIDIIAGDDIIAEWVSCDLETKIK